MNSLVIQSKVVGPVKNPNCKFTYVQLAKLFILFPFFSIKNAGLYANSGLGQLFSCKKDIFYRFMNNGSVNWRRIIIQSTISLSRESVAARIPRKLYDV